jgi:muramoyltetrapeptide carboxypeptidase LdcA involved in peptidoglycan recycling
MLPAMYVRPPAVRPGDTVAVVSLSAGGAARFPARFARGCRQLAAALAVDVVLAPNALRDSDYLSANPQARVDDWTWALTNPAVRAYVSAIGGEDSVRLLPLLDHALLSAHPKAFLGFSDSTASLTALGNAGVVAFHGPAVLCDLAEFGGIRPDVVAALTGALCRPEPLGALRAAPEWTEEFVDWAGPERSRRWAPNSGWRWLQGRSAVTGAAIGGSLEVLEMLRGTPWWPAVDRWRGAVLLLETSEEAPPPGLVRRWLRGYASMGVLEVLGALLVARPMGYDHAQVAQLDREVLAACSEAGRGDLPVVTGLDFGHTSPAYVLPLGCRVTVDPAARAITVDEPAVA